MNLSQKLIIATTMLLASIAGMTAQRTTLLSSTDGLSSSLINKIYQDSKGYIWIATEYGLNRFDGTSMKAYYKDSGSESSLCDSYVHTMIESRQGYMLVGTVKGLMEWDRGSESFRKLDLFVNKQLVHPHVTDMKRLSNGEIWIGTAGYGLFRHNPETGETLHIDGISDFVDNAFISCIYEDSSHTIWIGTENKGICRYYPSGRKVRIYRRPEINGEKVTSVVEDTAAGVIYVGSLDGGVASLDLATGMAKGHACDGGAVAVKTLARVNGACYAGTEGHGIKLVTPEGMGGLPLSSPLVHITSGKVHQMVADKDGNLWIGLYQQGVRLIPSQRLMFDSYGSVSAPANPIGDGCVMAICPTDDHHIWVSCDNEGIYELDENHRRVRHIALPSTAMCLLADSKGRLWAGTFNSGLFRIQAGVPSSVKNLENCKIYSLREDSGGCLYVGTFGKGMLRYDPESGEVAEATMAGTGGHDSNKPKDWINNILVHPDGKVWLAHYGGVSCFDPRKRRFEKFADKENLVDGCLGYVLHRDAKGRIWCGTSNGLYVYDPATKALDHHTTGDGLPNNVVCGICEDEGGNMWISTYHGIAKYETAKKRFVAFDAGDGLQSNEFTHGAYCKDPTGNVYFGGVNGFSTFYPYDINDKPREYRPVLTEMTIFSTPVTTRTLSGGEPVMERTLDETDGVTLANGDNTFTIGFSTLTYDNPDKLVYEYRILEYGKDWLTTMPGQNHVTLNNMGAGKYHFQVRVAGDSSTEGTRELLIEVRPPWHQTWWAMLLYAAVAALMILGAVHFMKLKATQHRERDERRRSEQILEAKLQFFTNISHEIRTPMTLIINPLERLLEQCQDPHLKSIYSIIYRNAQRILSLVNQLMDMRKLEKGQVKMQMRETDLVSFINNAMLPFEYIAGQKKMEFTFIHSQDSLNAWIDVNYFDKVLLNVFSNAFKYTPEGGKIEVRLARVSDRSAAAPLDDCVEICVSDNGIGIAPDKLDKIFDRFYRVSNEITDSASGTGIGLHLCRSLVELHHGSITARNHEGDSGCEFIIRIPAGKGHLTAEEFAPADMPAHMPRHAMPALSEETTDDSARKPRTKKTVAIVEDDTDIRNFLTAELGTYYKVVAFNNADDALKSILSKEAPDIIISDVMMPGTDGYELCHRIKQNVNINHIPVILVSARTDDKDRMLGLEAGADSYLAKPFNVEVLKTTVASLLANRNLLKAKYSGAQEQEETVKKISLKSHDEVLLKKIMDVINDNISSADFSVEKLAAEVGLSRVHLHRKLKELTNMPARDFIKSLRMRQAARLLKEKKLSVAEVAYATGFSNPSHFSNSFKEMYGVPPTAYSPKPEEATGGN